MADSKKVVLTYEGLKKLEDELEDLKTVKRKEVAEKIEDRETCPKMPSMTLQKKNRAK